MKKKFLYIIDDDANRQQNKFKPYLDLIDLQKSEIEFIHKTTQTSINDILLNAVCVCLHTTTKDGRDKDGKRFDFERLKLKLMEDEIPYVLFSNAGNRNTVLDGNLTLSMSSDDFYMNLPAFVESINKKNNVDLEILALGKNYSRERINHQKAKLLNYFEKHESDEGISLSAEKRKEFMLNLEVFGELTQENNFASSVFKKLNSDALTRLYFEQLLNSIIKFIR